jgi:hypothetical protein
MNFAAVTVAALRESPAMFWSREDARGVRRRLTRRIFRNNDLPNGPRWNLILLFVVIIILLVVVVAGIAWNEIGRFSARYQLTH